MPSRSSSNQTCVSLAQIPMSRRFCLRSMHYHKSCPSSIISIPCPFLASVRQLPFSLHLTLSTTLSLPSCHQHNLCQHTWGVDKIIIISFQENTTVPVLLGFGMAINEHLPLYRGIALNFSLTGSESLIIPDLTGRSQLWRTTQSINAYPEMGSLNTVLFTACF